MRNKVLNLKTFDPLNFYCSTHSAQVVPLALVTRNWLSSGISSNQVAIALGDNPFFT